MSTFTPLRRNMLLASIGVPLVVAPRVALPSPPTVRMTATGPKLAAPYEIDFPRWSKDAVSTGKVQVNLNVGPPYHQKTSCACEWHHARFYVQLENGFEIVGADHEFDPIDCYTANTGRKADVPEEFKNPAANVVHDNLRVEWKRDSVNTGAFLIGAKNDNAKWYTGTAMVYFTIRYR